MACSVRVGPAAILAAAARRRCWRWWFAGRQDLLGSFFLDPRDHIGRERIVLGREYEYEVLAVLGRLTSTLGLGGGVAFDVGANIGNHSRWLCSRFSAVDCIEPGRAAALVLEANLVASGRSNWRVHRCALGARANTAALRTDDHRNLGSSRVEEVQGGEVEIVRGDDIWTACHAADTKRLELVKIDVEGMENAVIDGMELVLADQKPAVCVEVMEQRRWAILQAQAHRLGYAGIWAIEEIGPGHSRHLRRWSLLRGRRYGLVRTSAALPARGYEMAVCLSAEHLSRLSDAGLEPDQA